MVGRRVTLLRYTHGAVSLPDAPTEAGTTRDGFLSYAGEWHALALGLAAGIMFGVEGDVDHAVGLVGVALGGKGIEGAKSRIGNSKAASEISSEPWYAAGGVLVGLVFGLGLRVVEVVG